MKRGSWGCASACLLLAASSLAAQEAKPPADSLSDAFRQGTFGGGLRYRSDYVDRSGTPRSALASTLRSALHFTTARYHGCTGFVELYSNESIGEDAYFGITNGKSGSEYPLIPDPEGSGVNRAWVRYENPELAALSVTVGRQFLHWNDGRMLTNSYYRQNQNTFDAATVAFRAACGLEATYAYMWQQDDVFFRVHDMSSHAGQLAWVRKDRVRVSAYATWMDYADVPNWDRDTYGLRVTGPWQLCEGLGIHYAAEYARQSDSAENPRSVDGDYIIAELGVVGGGYLLYVGYNRVGGTANGATELPFDHFGGFPFPYRGDTEQMVVTPTAGIETWLFRGAGPLPCVPGARFVAHFQRMRQETGSLNYGTDVGMTLSYASKDAGWSMFVRAARLFDADVASGVRNTTRLIFGAEYPF